MKKEFRNRGAGILTVDRCFGARSKPTSCKFVGVVASLAELADLVAFMLFFRPQ